MDGATGVIDLRLGDCLDVMRSIPSQSIDAVITDPPYAVGLDYGGLFVDDIAYAKKFLPILIEEGQRIAKRVIFPSGRYEIETWLMQNYTPRWRLCWYKGAQSTASPIGFSDFELMFIYGDKIYRSTHDYFFVKTENEKNVHPCPKSVGWATMLINKFTEEGDTVLDPFMGSGTTGVACVKLNRNFIGIEISEQYFAIAQRRIQEAQAQLSMPIFTNVGNNQ